MKLVIDMDDIPTTNILKDDYYLLPTAFEYLRTKNRLELLCPTGTVCRSMGREGSKGYIIRGATLITDIGVEEIPKE